ncbi:DUF4190 domain-containing protein [Mycobacterium sp. MYCO198283]|uniref:DUF4190 domain-containing protein n=1 Tax=Mycobacterium sp. MYCO198283 TaxID=2883505 RepID=UPI001E362C28|nr:DUF4190 domain-containing protein [Mycobacterium sp. MYCO198283]MCG5433489.1 DUF4190 domain-containing protein [Mycobacterium sp. MYCO198283]
MTDSPDSPESSSGTPQPGYPPPPPPSGASYPPPPPPSSGGYPPPPPQPYADYGAPTPAAPRNGLGVTSLVLSIIGILSSPVIIGLVLGIVGLVLGILGRKRVSRGEADNGGLALAGIVLSVLAIVLGIVFAIIWITAGTWFWNELGGQDFVDCVNDAGNDATARQACESSFSSQVEDRLSTTLTP